MEKTDLFCPICKLRLYEVAGPDRVYVVQCRNYHGWEYTVRESRVCLIEYNRRKETVEYENTESH